MRSGSRRPTVLIVDDEPNFSESLQMALDDRFAVSVAGSLKKARDLLRGKTPDALLLDLRLQDGDGIDFLRSLKREMKRMPVVIIMTAYATVENAVQALKEGAVDYFTKPLDIDKLQRELHVYIENRILHDKVAALDREINRISPPFATSGTGKMKEIVDKVPMVAPLDIPVLIMGETGTGKEKLAQWIHALSGVEGGMVVINCAALPRDILESELFGYAKGAFSGATGHKEGLIEKADGGTLFLDEIGELAEDIQAKFLRVLEEGVYYKLGDTTEHKVKFRLITASNRDLSGPSSGFRQDLFFRVHGITFELPSLRERRQDIPLLVSVFLKEANTAYRKDVKGVSAEALELLMNYTWPGNIRELKWCIGRAVAVAAKDVLEVGELAMNREIGSASPEGNRFDRTVPLEQALSLLERRYIEDALLRADNNKTAAAKALGLSVRVLHYKIRKHNLECPPD